MNRSAALIGLTLFLVSVSPGMALDQPVVWRDEDTGCAYLLTPQGGITPRFRRDGALDCPDVTANTRIIDNTARNIARGLDALQREVERLRRGYDGDRP